MTILSKNVHTYPRQSSEISDRNPTVYAIEHFRPRLRIEEHAKIAYNSCLATVARKQFDLRQKVAFSNLIISARRRN